MAKKNITNPLLEALKKDKETRIAKGQDYDPQKVEKLSAGPGVDYKGLESSYKQHDIDAFDNYEDYIDEGTLKGGQFSFDRLNKMRAENQSNWEQLGHKTEQIATNIVPQILAGVSSMIDIPGYWDAEHAAQNEIVKWANDVKQWSGQKFGVYRENPDKPMDFGDMAWWIDNGGDLAESVGSFMAQGWGVGAALGGIGKIAQLRKFANAVSGGRGALVGNAVNKLAAATMLNQSEAVMEASQVYSDTMSYWRDKGYTADEAKKKAAIAASTTMNINRANILLNITSAGAFLTPLKYSRNLLTAPGGVLKTLGKVASEGGQEALEESINHVGSKAGMAHGRGEEYTLEKAFKDATSSQGLEAALLGAVGGIAQTGGTDLLKLSKYGPGSGKDENGNRINAYKKEAQEYAKQQQIIEQQRATGVRNSDLLHTVEKAHKFASDLQKAHSEGNEAKVKELTSQMFENQAIEHFKAGTTEVFEEMLRAVGSEEGAQEMGIEPQHIEEAVKHLHELEKIYNNYEMYENTDDIVMNRAKNIRLNKVLEHQQRVQSEGESVFNKSVSDTARNYTVNQDQTILNKKEGKLQSTDTITHKVPMPYSMTEVEQDVEKVINSNGADVKLTDKGSVENNETYRKFIDELVAKDSTHDHIENTQILNDLKSQSSTLDKDLRTLKSKEVQQKAKAENDSNKLENEHLDIANNPKSTISQLEKIKSETKNDKVKGIVEARIEQLKTEQTEKKNAKVEKTEVDKFSKKINKATLDQIESIVTDVQANTNLSQAKKDELIKQVDSRRNELNGEPISEVTQDVVDSNEESHDQEKEAEATVRENQQAVEKNEFVPHDADDDFEKEIDESLKELGEKEAVIGKDGKTVYVYTRAKSGSTKFAYQARGFRQIDNEGLVSREEFEDVLNEINPKLLNPTGLKVGDKISFKVNDDDKTLVYSADSNTKEKITWGERKAQIGNDPAKIAEEMPIQILDENGGVLCYLHDAKWISDENLENTEEEIEKDKQKLIKIRKFILTNPTKAVTKINKKGPGVLFKTADNKPIAVSDAMKDPNLTIAIVKDDVFIGYGVKGEIKGAVPQQGRTYAIVPFGDKQIAIPLKRSTLSQESVKSIVKAIELYFEQDSENQTVKDILEKQKLDITNLQQLRTYISSFIQVLNLDTNMTDKMNELGAAVGSDNYLFGISGNGIEWGRPTVGTQWLSLEKTPSENVADKIAKLEKHLSKMLTGSNKELISRKNANIQIINEDGSTSTISYKEHLKNSFETNVLSAKVKTAEGDKYVYSIQSNIEFDPSFAQVENAQPEITKKVTSNIDTQKADIEKRRKEELKSEEYRITESSELFKDNEGNFYKVEKLKNGKNKVSIADENGRTLGFLDDYDNSVSLDTIINGKEGSYGSAKEGRLKLTKEKDLHFTNRIVDKINAKYDAELAVLEPETNKTQSNTVSDINDFLNNWKKEIFSNEEESTEISNRLKSENAGKTYNSASTAFNENKEGTVFTITTVSNARTHHSGTKGNVKNTTFEAIKVGNVLIHLEDFQRGSGIFGRPMREMNPAQLDKNNISINLEVTYVETIAKKESVTKETKEEITKEKIDIENDINKLFRQYSKDIHPDLAVNNLIKELSEEYFKRINDARRNNNIVLLKKIKKEYDIKLNALKIKLAALEQSTNLENEVVSKEEYHETQDISTLFKKEELPSDFDDIDLSDFPDIDVDYMIDTVDDKQISEVVKYSIEKLLIKGLSPSQQQEVIDYLAISIVADAIKQKDETGKPKFDSIKIFEEKRKQLEQLYKVYTDNKLTVKAEKIKAILDNYSKIKVLTGEHLSKIATGRVSEINIDELNDTNDGDLNTTWSDDFSLTMDSKNSVSANLKRFFSFIENVDDNGKAKRSPLGFVEIIPFDKVYNTLHEVLANLPSDYDTIIETLEANTIRFPWLKNVVDKLENASEQVQNEFVSDMTKRGLNMKWISWNKQKDGRYAMVVSDANSNSTQNRLIELWSANIFDPSNQFKLVKENDAGEYIMDPEVVEKMKTISDKWFGKDRVVPNADELHQWLNGFGIKLSDKALTDLQKGKYVNKKALSYDSLFTGSTGLVKVLATYLKDGKFNENLFKDTAVKSLANLESVYAENVFSNSFRAGNKTIYTFTNNNYLSNRVRSLMEDPALLDELSKLSFNGTSSWLEMLQDDSELGKEFRSQFGYSQLSLEALKKQFTPSVDNRKLNNLNVDEHEVCKLSFFFNGYSSDLINGEKFRKVSFFYPTNSDKTNVFLINTLAREIEMDNDGNVSNDNIQLLYDNVVLPEINRMIANIKANNVKGYNPNLFYLMPTLNEVKIGDEYVRDMIIDSNEASPQVVTALKEELNNVLKALVDEKLEDWKTLGIGITDKKQNIKDSFLDKDYMDKVAKGQGVTYAATDMVFNELIANAEIHKLIIGDIALFYKTKEGFTTQQTLEETYINLGKRLAGDIAPGTEIANSEHNQYYQVFFNDRKLGSNAVLDKATKEYMKSFLSEKDFKKYSEGIEGSDAQEYTTWKEHIFVMKGLGKLTKEEYDRIHNRLSQGLKLSVDDLDLVLQPMKPVYVGNIAEVGNNVDRRLYIKSSSFPLIPELTSGLQIDKIRKAMEDFEDDLQTRNIVNKDGTKPTVRASFNTANKVGGITNSIEVFDNNGDVNDIVIKDSNSLLLPRKNFRIQQEVPHDDEKTSVNIGTQGQVMLFNNIHDVDGFEHDGKKMTGSELEEEYTNYYHRLFKYKQEKFMKNRGMIEELVNESDIDNLVDIPDSNVFAQLESMKTEMDQEASGIKKSAIRAKYEEMVGKDALRRAEFINKNFEKIISKFAEAKINIFFDENGETKKCD